MSLDPDQQQFITTAQGYVDLGMYLEANEELEKMDAFVRHVPEVLQVRVKIYEHLEKWDLMQAVAKKLAQSQPENAQWWISWAYATRQGESPESAKPILLMGLERHPMNAAICFDLACDECQLGNMEFAKKYLKRSFELDTNLKLKALEDKAFETVWDSLAP